MAKPLHAEHMIHQGKALPDFIEVCLRCRRGVVMYKGAGISYMKNDDCPQPECNICSENEPGQPYSLFGLNRGIYP